MGRVSYKDFINEFEKDSKKDGNMGRKFFQSIIDMLSHIGQLIVKRGIKNLGNLLAGYDLDGNGKIERNSFYRVIESMKFGLGEGDIQELLKHYDALNIDQISI